MKNELSKIAQDLEQGTITETEAQTLLLGLLGVSKRFYWLKPDGSISNMWNEEDHLKFMRAALGFVEPEYSRNIFNPKTNMFTDLYEVFTEPPKKGTIKMTLGSQGKTASASIAAAQGSELKPEMYNLSAPKPEVKAAPEVKPAASAPAPVSSAAKVDSAKPAAVETKPAEAPKTDAKPEVKTDAAKAESPKGK